MKMTIASTAIKALIVLNHLACSTIAKGLSHIHVKVAPGVNAESDIESLLDDVVSIKPLFTLPPSRLRELSSAKPNLPDLTLWRDVTVRNPSSDGIDAANFFVSAEQQLNSLSSIESVVVSQSTDPPPPSAGNDMKSSAATPDFVANQGYLKPNTPANNGIDAEKSWTYPGGAGAGITVYDVEYDWSQTHEDLGPIPVLVNAGDSGNSPWDDNGHGTAVLGEIHGNNNAFGIKGISYDADVKVCPERTVRLGGNRGNAIILAVNDGKPGDVILLEMQTWACGASWPSNEYGPAEEDDDVFEATQVAIANGITVVAAAGNGNIDLDKAACNNKYNRNVRDSGAIMVGAGGSGRTAFDPARQKLGFSSHGSRVDVHGWGRNVWTTGYGNGHRDPDNQGNQDLWYTSTFSGTSSASPIVAAAAANIQGIAIQQFGAPLDPIDLRTLLKDTGLPQIGGGGNIGPLVNLASAIDKLLATTTTPAPTTPPTVTPVVPTNNPDPSPVAEAPTTNEVENWVLINSNTFEDQSTGIFPKSIANKMRDDVAYDGSTWSLRMRRKNKVPTRRFNINQYSKVKVEFMYRPVDTDEDDYFEIETKFNNAAWEQYESYVDLTNDEWKKGTTIIDDFGEKNFLRIRFHSQQDDVDDKIYIDNVEIYGMV